LARGKAFHIVGEKDKAEAEFRAALAFDANMAEARAALAHVSA
jgi:hypothetical protein